MIVFLLINEDSVMGIKGLQDRMKPSVYGVGYLGGNLELKSTYNGKKCNIYTQWKNMIERCYNEKFHQRQPTYEGCTVSDEFKDYSKWREWYDNYQYKQDDWHLDKDLLVKGNKVYSEDYCVFLPKEINSVLTKRTALRGEYLIGVCWHNTNKAFVAKVNKNKGNPEWLGSFNTEIEAFNAYKQSKESYIKELADKYKDILDPRAYEALYNYTVDVDD